MKSYRLLFYTIGIIVFFASCSKEDSGPCGEETSQTLVFEPPYDLVIESYSGDSNEIVTYKVMSDHIDGVCTEGSASIAFELQSLSELDFTFSARTDIDLNIETSEVGFNKQDMGTYYKYTLSARNLDLSILEGGDTFIRPVTLITLDRGENQNADADLINSNVVNITCTINYSYALN